MIKVPKCPLCGSELIEIVESGRSSGSKTVGASPADYSGSIDVFIAPNTEISIRYYKCSNPDCPYREIINNH
jgi:hypothetical protein